MAAKFAVLRKSIDKLYISGALKPFTPSYCSSKCVSTSAKRLGSVPVKMPALSPTMTQGTIQKWYKKEGDAINAGDVLCDIETDKAVVSMEIEDEGVLAKILKPEGTRDVELGTLIAVMVEEGDDWKTAEIPVEEGAAVAAAPAAAAPAAAPAAEAAPMARGAAGVAASRPTLDYSPAVRSMLDIYQLHNVDIPCTGPHGRLLKGDILKYIAERGLKPAPPPSVPLPGAAAAAPPAQPAPAAAKPAAPAAPAAPRPSIPPPAPVATEGYTDIDLTNMRKTIAKRLTESKSTIPHAYSSIACNMAEVTKLRKQLLEDGVKVSVNDFIIKAAAVALQRVPQVNAILDGESVRLMNNIDVSVAVATPSGLITPIVTDAVNRGVADISSTVKEMAGRARDGKLKPHEFMGGTFTISNLGMFGISEFTAVINPPQACILAIGTSRIVPNPSGGDPLTLMTVQMSSDARVVDDAVACQFLSVFKDVMERPMLMVSGGDQASTSKLFAR